MSIFTMSSEAITFSSFVALMGNGQVVVIAWVIVGIMGMKVF